MPPTNLSRPQILSAIRLHHLLSVVAEYHYSQAPTSFLEGDAEAGAYWTLGSRGVEASSFRWDVHGFVGVGVDRLGATAGRADKLVGRPLQYLTGLPSDLEPLALAAAAALQNRVIAGCWIGRDQRAFIAQKHSWNGIIHASVAAMIASQEKRLDRAHGTVAEEIITVAGPGHVAVTEAQAAVLLTPPARVIDDDDYEWPSPYSLYRLRWELGRHNIHWPGRSEPWTSSKPRRSLHRAFRRHALLWTLARQTRDSLLVDCAVEPRVYLEGDDREGYFLYRGFSAHWSDAGLVAVESGARHAQLSEVPSNLEPMTDLMEDVDFLVTEDRVVTLAASLGPHSTSLLEGRADPLESFGIPEALVHLTARLAADVDDFVAGQPLVPIAPALADELLAALPHLPPTREAARALQWALARVGLSWAIPPALYPVPAEVPAAPLPEVDDIDEEPSTTQPVETFAVDGLDTVPALGAPPIFAVEEQDAAQVYGDWLEQQGHPLGRWVALHRALENEHSDEIVHSLTQMSEQYGEHLLPTLDQTPEWPAYVLRSGLIHAARIMPHDQRTPLAARVRRLLSHPAALLIRGLVIGHGLSRDMLGLSAAVDALAEAPRCLDALYLVQNFGAYPNSALVGARLWEARPHLRKLILNLTDCALGPIDAPHLEHLGLRVSMRDAVVRDVTAAPLPSLTTLDIDVLANSPVALLTNLIAPRLRELRLGMIGRPLMIHELDTLCSWPGFQSLRILQLSDPSSNDGCFDGSFLHAFAQRFAHLEEIRLVPTRFGAFSSVEGVHPFRVMHPSRSVRDGDPLVTLCPIQRLDAG